MPFTLFNSLTRQKEAFLPLRENRVDFYSCGPTVYDLVHVGNLRAVLFYDTLFRWLTQGCGYEVRWVMNITDVDDKTIKGAEKRYPSLSPEEALRVYTREYEELFFKDLEVLSLSRKVLFQTPRATEAIAAMQELIRNIAAKGFAYEKDGSVYFSLSAYLRQEKYGKLVNLDMNQLKTGTRTLADEIEKENVQDFVLWKGKKADEPFWDFTFEGTSLPGRPGWHIECSAMGMEAFGEFPFDIHAGGVDLKFPHHEDEIAQSVAGYGVEPAHFWAHNEHLLVEGEKMSKSLGNFYTLEDLVRRGHSAEAVRFFLVSNHYRTKLNLTEEALQASATALYRLRNGLASRKKEEALSNGEGGEFLHRFREAFNDDLNAPQAVAVLFEALAADISRSAERELFDFAEKIMGVRFLPREFIIPPEIEELARKRQRSKEEKDFLRADELRREIISRGFELRDIPGGYEILPAEL